MTTFKRSRGHRDGDLPQSKGRSAIKGRRAPLGRQAWLDAARQALIEEGTAGVEIMKLAKRLRLTNRGGFYWFFRSRAHLLDELLKYWAETSSVQFERVLAPCGGDGQKAYHAIIDLWVDESSYDPRWDGAVRDWARTSQAVLRVVQVVDKQRINSIERIFLNLGYRGTDAHIRARVMYYHQVGYYALGVKESRKARRRLLPYYRRVLIGIEYGKRNRQMRPVRLIKQQPVAQDPKLSLGRREHNGNRENRPGIPVEDGSREDAETPQAQPRDARPGGKKARRLSIQK
jgi:AcrR family transcriptional regulator